MISTQTVPTSASAAVPRHFVFLLGGVQFANVLDMAIVGSLAPDIARDLNFPASELGWPVGGYMAGATIATLFGGSFLGKHERRRMLGLVLCGLCLTTVACALATSVYALTVARFAAGLFGGPCGALAWGALGDRVPPEQLGKASGVVTGFGSLGLLVGAPASLELARWLGWRAALLAMAMIVATVALLTVYYLPELPPPRAAESHRKTLLQSRKVLAACGLSLIAWTGQYSITPHVFSMLLFNLKFPRSALSVLTFVGGVVTITTLRSGGRVYDRLGAQRMSLLSAAVLASVLFMEFVCQPPLLPAVAFYLLFAFGNALRLVTYSAFITRAAPYGLRVQFLSLQSTCQYVAAAFGSALSTRLLHTLPDQTLVGTPRIGVLAMAMALLIPVCVRIVLVL